MSVALCRWDVDGGMWTVEVWQSVTGPRRRRAHTEIVELEVHGLKFGSVQVTVREGRAVQIERSARIRFGRR